jgi:endonuclease-3
MSAVNNASPTTRSSSLRLQKFTHDSTTSPNRTIDTDNTSEASTTGTTRKRKRTATFTKVENAVSETLSVPTTSTKKRRQPAKVKKGPSGNVTAQAPSHWKEMFDLVKESRLANPTAPVDTMGCERLADPNASERDQRFQTLISLMLSSQTKDQVTAAAIRTMQRDLPGGLTLESILAVEPEKLNELIGKVGFHNTKTKNIKKTAEILRDTWDSDIPDSAEGLISLPGVGPKMAYLTLSAGWGRTEGIGVDVHVHRITNLWNWHKTKGPEETRVTLEAWLPKEHWHEINWLLVGHGQTICLPVGRKCGDCVLGASGLCPAAVGVKRVKKEAKVEVKLEEEGGSIAETVVVKEEVKAETLIKSEEVVDIEDLALRSR